MELSRGKVVIELILRYLIDHSEDELSGYERLYQTKNYIGFLCYARRKIQLTFLVDWYWIATPIKGCFFQSFMRKDLLSMMESYEKTPTLLHYRYQITLAPFHVFVKIND